MMFSECSYRKAQAGTAITAMAMANMKMGHHLTEPE
jgi:hypothetical protein